MAKPTWGFDWQNFPPATVSRKLINQLLSRYGCGKGERPPAPYQFTLQVMFGLYCHLQPKIKFKTDIECVGGDYYVRNPDKIVKRRSVPNPYYYKRQALKAPLRAMAYFSWEAEKRVFLVRRVYPTYFDFLSYSHVPEEWGALGIMLKECAQIKNSTKAFKGYTAIPDVHGRQSLLPYLREIDRLKYARC